jgi:aryl-alcohol dehydrogenase-like predicted oxidoreductase
MMRYKFLGQSGLRISEICLGTMSFGDAWGFGAERAESHRVLDAFAKAGGNFLDTANKYHEGQSEEIVGEFVRSDRDRWVLGTKYTLAMDKCDPNAAGNSRKNMMRSLEGSLRRLGTDHVDLLWVHAWDFTTPVEEVMRGLDDLVRSGKVLYLGISDAPAWVVAQANTLASLRGWTPFVAAQLHYSLVERTIERELIPMAASFGLAVTAWAPLAAGVLTGKYTRGTRDSGVPEDSKRTSANQHRLTERNLAIAREVDAVADALGKTSAQVAVNWVRQRSDETNVTILPIVGIRKLGQLEDVLGSLDFRLSDEHMNLLDRASRIESGFPADFLSRKSIRGVVYGDLEACIDLPFAARPRRGI